MSLGARDHLQRAKYQLQRAYEETPAEASPRLRAVIELVETEIEESMGSGTERLQAAFFETLISGTCPTCGWDYPLEAAESANREVHVFRCGDCDLEIPVSNRHINDVAERGVGDSHER